MHDRLGQSRRARGIQDPKWMAAINASKFGVIVDWRLRLDESAPRFNWNAQIARCFQAHIIEPDDPVERRRVCDYGGNFMPAVVDGSPEAVAIRGEQYLRLNLTETVRDDLRPKLGGRR